MKVDSKDKLLLEASSFKVKNATNATAAPAKKFIEARWSLANVASIAKKLVDNIKNKTDNATKKKIH
jgi:hypothetical protein